MADDPWAAFSPQAAPSAGAAADPWGAFNPQGAATKPELPDVGPPAITAGQQQFSPGVPAVNEEVDRIARSANKNLIEPITHPIDTLTGIGRVGLGAAQYVGLPGEEYKKDIDALAADYKKTYGSMEGFKNALVEDPVRVGLDASMGLGALRGLGRRAGVLPRPAPRVEVPSTEELHDASQGHYNAVHGFGVEMRPGFGHDIADNILNELHAESYRDYLAPKTFSAIEELRTPAGQNVGTQDLEGVRRLLNRVAADPVERDAARRAIGQIDDALVNLDPADAVVNAHFAPRVAQEATRARGDYAAYKQAQQIEQATDAASLETASTGAGTNIDNKTRQKFRAILTNPKKARGYSREELAQMRQLVEGTAGGNAARFVGKLAPSGIVSGGLSAALGHAIGHTAGVPIVGYVAKQLADAATARAAARLSEQRRLRSPEARRIGAVAAPPVLPRVAIGMPRAMAQYGRLNNQSNPYAP